MSKSSPLLIVAALCEGSAVAGAYRYGTTFGHHPGNLHIGSAIVFGVPLILCLGLIVMIWLTLSRREYRQNSTEGMLWRVAVPCVLGVIGSVLSTLASSYCRANGEGDTALRFIVAAAIFFVAYVYGISRLDVAMMRTPKPRR